MYLHDSLLNASLIIRPESPLLIPYLKYQPAFAKIQHYKLCQDHVISINTDCQKKKVGSKKKKTQKTTQNSESKQRLVIKRATSGDSTKMMKMSNLFKIEGNKSNEGNHI